MPTLLYLLCVAAFCAAIFVTGVHNASNAIAVPVRTRAMTPVAALVVSALFNGAGVILAYMLIKEYEASWLVVPGGTPTLLGIVCALTTTAAWGTITWAMRMPSSATHAL
ncbi:MAG: inorganic phosphate transporter, partial [Rothia sp. (in: high G+C Gram-positive bacteria)]